MARIARSLTVQSGLGVHKVWRGHNKEANLGTASQKESYLEMMNQDLESEKYESGSELEALTLMMNHTHEVSDIQSPKQYSGHMRRHHARYGRYFNDTNQRCGKVAQDRPHTTLLADDEHRMRCVFYVHANPHRAGVADAEHYEYSTHQWYAYGKRRPWMRNVKLPRWYMALGRTMEQRQRKYRQLFAQYLKTYGLVKQGFVRKRFFGPVLWVLEQQKLVRQWRKQHERPAPS